MKGLRRLLEAARDGGHRWHVYEACKVLDAEGCLPNRDPQTFLEALFLAVPTSEVAEGLGEYLRSRRLEADVGPKEAMVR